jgi:DnaJ-class molecular chaperone
MNTDIYVNYETLGLNVNATDVEIKLAYKKLCLLYHPDKSKADSNMFIKITNAYNKINEYKKQNVNFYMYFICMYQYYMKALKDSMKDIHIKCVVNIEDIYYVKVKKIEYTISTNTFIKQNKTLYLELSGYKKEYVLEEHGDYNIFTKKYNDLRITLDILHDEKYQLNDIIDPYEVYLKHEINIYQYFYGIKYDIPYMGNECIESYGYIPNINGMTQIFKNMGLCDEENVKHSLIVIYEVNLKLNYIEDFENVDETLKMYFNYKNG